MPTSEAPPGKCRRPSKTGGQLDLMLGPDGDHLTNL
jgi:hypothetical protein